MHDVLMAQATAVADFLRPLPGVHGVAPAVVTINRITYAAARFFRDYAITPGCRAYTEGQRHGTEECVYVTGMLPTVTRRANVAFRIGTDARDWYVGSYAGQVRRGRQEVQAPDRVHPFGNSFILFPWSVPGSTIDAGERRPYRRVAITVAPLIPGAGAKGLNHAAIT